jgi:predicted TIM-barrel fold metal-dependent hydrolase
MIHIAHVSNSYALDRLPLISADSHVQEPPDFFTSRLAAKWHEELPPGMRPEADSAVEFGKGIGAHERSNAVMEDISRGRSNSAQGRIDVMREDGIAGECIFPTRSLPVWSMTNADAQRACCELYNDWVHDALESRSPRFRCAALIPMRRIADAIAEVERVAKLGLGAAMLPLVGTPEYNHRDWGPLWSCLEDAGLPIVMHQGTGHDMLFYRGRGAAVANLLATQSMAPRVAGLLATSGVLASHPKLHFVFVETNAAWISWAMTTLDFYYDRFQQYPGWVRPILPEKPSHFIARQVHGTFQFDPVAVRNLPSTGAAPLLWGSDFPHAEGTYPKSRETVRALFEGVPVDAASAIVAGNAARLFRFDPEILATPA